MMKRFIVLIMAICTMTGCFHKSDKDNLGPARDAYNSNLAKWQAANIHDYQFTYSTYCFCAPFQNVVVIVKQDKVNSAFYQESGEYLPEDQLTGLPTIDSLFNIIDDAISRNAYKLTANYNGDYGYPTDVSIDYLQNAVDEEFAFSVNNFM